MSLSSRSSSVCIGWPRKTREVEWPTQDLIWWNNRNLKWVTHYSVSERKMKIIFKPYIIFGQLQSNSNLICISDEWFSMSITWQRWRGKMVISATCWRSWWRANHVRNGLRKKSLIQQNGGPWLIVHGHPIRKVRLKRSMWISWSF
jgi:hypothetical protein